MISRSVLRLARASKTQGEFASLNHFAPSSRGLHSVPRVPTITASHNRHRPRLQRDHQKAVAPTAPNQPSSRTIFIQTQTTPNADALKFLPNHTVLPENFPSTFVEYTSPRSTLAPPHPSPLASRLLSVDGVSSIFYGTDFITVTKAADVNWAHIKPEVFSLITEAVTAGEPIVTTTQQGAADDGQSIESDSLAADDDDDEVVAMIKELLETRIRPAIQEDGGDIEFRGFENGMVNLKLRGACRTCDSSTVTLKNGIESMLMHYVSRAIHPLSPHD
jgi:NFU1 iron-sulfur cluster scaffold homolog, mitochondrial